MGGISGALALRKRSEIDKSADCRDSHCQPSMQGTVDSLNSFRTVSTVGFVAGGVFAATGLGLLLAAGSSHDSGRAARCPPPALHLTVQLLPGSVAVLGNF